MVKKQGKNVKKTVKKKTKMSKSVKNAITAKDEFAKYKHLTPDARREKMRELIGLVKNSVIAKMFGISHKQVLRDIESIGKQALQESEKTYLLVQDDALMQGIKRTMRRLLDSSNQNAQIGAARVLIQHSEHAIKVRQDLGILELPKQRVEQMNLNAVTYDDFQEAYEELSIETIGKEQKDKGSSCKTLPSVTDSNAVQDS